MTLSVQMYLFYNKVKLINIRSFLVWSIFLYCQSWITFLKCFVLFGIPLVYQSSSFLEDLVAEILDVVLTFFLIIVNDLVGSIVWDSIMVTFLIQCNIRNFDKCAHNRRYPAISSSLK